MRAPTSNSSAAGRRSCATASRAASSRSSLARSSPRERSCASASTAGSRTHWTASSSARSPAARSGSSATAPRSSSPTRRCPRGADRRQPPGPRRHAVRRAHGHPGHAPTPGYAPLRQLDPTHVPTATLRPRGRAPLRSFRLWRPIPGFGHRLPPLPFRLVRPLRGRLGARRRPLLRRLARPLLRRVRRTRRALPHGEHRHRFLRPLGCHRSGGPGGAGRPFPPGA